MQMMPKLSLNPWQMLSWTGVMSQQRQQVPLRRRVTPTPTLGEKQEDLPSKCWSAMDDFLSAALPSSRTVTHAIAVQGKHCHTTQCLLRGHNALRTPVSLESTQFVMINDVLCVKETA